MSSPRLDPIDHAPTAIIQILGANRPWLADAACADLEPGQEDLFSLDGRNAALAAALPALLLCAQCPVWEVCGREAVEEGDAVNIRGGMTPTQRIERWPHLWGIHRDDDMLHPPMTGGRNWVDGDALNRVQGLLDEGMPDRTIAATVGISANHVADIRRAKPARRARDDHQEKRAS